MPCRTSNTHNLVFKDTFVKDQLNIYKLITIDKLTVHLYHTYVLLRLVCQGAYPVTAGQRKSIFNENSFPSGMLHGVALHKVMISVLSYRIILQQGYDGKGMSVPLHKQTKTNAHTRTHTHRHTCTNTSYTNGKHRTHLCTRTRYSQIYATKHTDRIQV